MNIQSYTTLYNCVYSQVFNFWIVTFCHRLTVWRTKERRNRGDETRRETVKTGSGIASRNTASRQRRYFPRNDSLSRVEIPIFPLALRNRKNPKGDSRKLNLIREIGPAVSGFIEIVAERAKIFREWSFAYFVDTKFRNYDETRGWAFESKNRGEGEDKLGEFVNYNV